MCNTIPRICGKVIVLWMILFTFFDLNPDADSSGQKKRVTWSENINNTYRSLSARTKPRNTQNYYGSVNAQTQPKLKGTFIPVSPVATMTVMEIIQYYGYKGEAHNVITEDGYILTKFRILPNATAEKYRGPILLWHGMLSSSAEWFCNTKENLIALQLSDAGYDVWIANARGTTYSRGHVNITITDPNYWEFSVNEIGKYDAPAVIDYILAKTGDAKLSYIGFSMGTTTFWVMMSHRPEYNDKLKLMIAWGASVYMKDTSGGAKLFTLISQYTLLQDVGKLLLNGDLVPFGVGPLLHWVGSQFCAVQDPYKMVSTLCSLGMHIGAGYTDQLDPKRSLSVMIGQLPASVSVRTGLHMAQFIKPGIFREFDFGKKKNLKVYGKPTPPLYDLKKTTTHCALFYGPTDIIAAASGSERLAEELPNVSKHPIAHKYFNHLDFVVSKDLKVLVNDPCLKLLEQY